MLYNLESQVNEHSISSACCVESTDVLDAAQQMNSAQ